MITAKSPLSRIKKLVASILVLLLLLEPSLSVLPRGYGGGVALASTGTQVGGTISQDTTWTAASSPYVVTSSITVNSGVKLTIEPGVVVKFNSQLSLNVNGTLIADGTPTEKIYFTSIKDDSVAGDTNGDGEATSPTKGDWSQISFASSAANSLLDNCVVKYGGYTTSGKYGAISVLCPSLTLTNTTIDTNNSYAVYSGANTTLIKSGNNATNNARNGVYIQNATTSTDTVWQGEDLPYVLYGFTVGQNKLHIVESGVVVKVETSGSLTVNGALSVAGTAERLVTFTSVKDDSISGDTNNDGAATLPARGNWQYIKFNDQSNDAASRVECATVRYGGYPYGSIYLSNASAAISNSIVEQSSYAGIYLDGASEPAITANTIRDNRYGIHTIDTSAPTITDNTITAHTSVSGSSGILLDGSSNAAIAANTISSNNYGVYATSSSRATLAFNLATGNISYPMVMAKNSMLDLSQNTAVANKYNAILLDGTRSTTSTIPRQELVYGIDSYFIPKGVTVTIEPGTIFKFQRYLSTFSVEGTLLAEAVGASEIVFTSMKDDLRGGDTNGDGSASWPARGDWYYVGVSGAGASGSRFENVGFYYGGWGSSASGYGALYIPSSSPTISSSRFENSYCSGIYVYGASSAPTIINSVFAKNAIGISFAQSSGIVKGNTIASNYDGLYTASANPAIHNNLIAKNSRYGLYNLSDAGYPIPSLYFNDLIGNASGNVYNWFSADFIDAKNNYWGSSAGPSTGDRYRTIYVPWSRIPYGAGVESRLTESVYGEDSDSGYFGELVNTASGNYTTSNEDILLPSKGIDLAFVRSYNSQDINNNGPLGYGWTHSYNTSLRFDEDSATTIFYPDGKRHTFSYDAETSSYTPPIAVFERLSKSVDSTYTVTFKNQDKFIYDAQGRLINQIDKYGNETALSYDTNGYLTLVSAPGGRSLSFTYTSGRISKVQDNAGREVNFSYDANGNLASVTDANGKTTTYSYDTEHRMLTIRKPKPTTNPYLTNHYGDGAVDYQYDAFMNQTSFGLDKTNKKNNLTSAKGQGSVHYFDSLLRQTKETNELGHDSSVSYNAQGLVNFIVNENSHTTSLFYDANGNETKTVDPAGHITKAEYDLSNNNLLWSEEANGARTTYTYDSTGKFLETAANPVAITRYVYYGDGLLHYLLTEDATTTYEYNSAGDLTKVTDPLGKDTTYEYDSAGRKTSMTDANSHTTRYTYDSLGNALTIKDPLSLIYPAERHQVDFTYDDNGNKETFKDAKGNLTRYLYDDRDSLIGVVDALENTTTYSYDANFNLTVVKDARENTTTYEDWPNNLLKSVKDALNNTTQFFYDGVGNLTKTIYPNGNEKYLEYTEDDLLKRITYKDEATSYTFDYNPTHTLKSVVDNLGRTFSFDYNLVGWLTGTIDTINPQISGGFSATRSYDEQGRVTGVKSSGDETTTFEYNARGDLTSLTLPSTATATFAYDNAGQRTSVATPNGVTRLYSFDAAGRVTSVEITGTASQHFNYTHDANGNILSENDTLYTYDALNRLRTWFNPANGKTTTYNFDAAGNLTSVVEDSQTVKFFSYNSANQITNTGFGYDANGNLTADGTHLYTYDSENRLKEVKRVEDSSTVASYEYDFLGRRIKSVEGTDTTFFHYDGDEFIPIAESNASGTIVARYYYYDNKDRLVAMQRGGELYYYQTNAHGDVISLTNSSGQVVNTYSYDPWGNILSSTEQVTNPYRYAGYRYDSQTGLYYLWKRYYKPDIGRFLTKDPDPGKLENPKTLNPYIYCENNPINMVDPDGDVAVLAIPAAYYVFVGVSGAIIATAEWLKTPEGQQAIRDLSRQLSISYDAAKQKIKAYFSKGKSFKKPKSGVSGKEGAKDVPSWARGNKPYVGESGKGFAKRLLDKKYGKGNYRTGANSEFNKIRKWGDRAFE